MSINTFANIQQKAQWVTWNMLDLLMPEMAVAPCYSSEYSDEFSQKFPVGRSVQVPLSQRYTVQRNDLTYNAQALDRPTTPLVVDQTATIPFDFDLIEQALDMERGGESRVREIYLKPLVAYAKQAVELDLAQFAGQNTNMVTGALGTDPTTFDATSAACLQKLTQMNCPTDDLSLFVSPAVNRAVKGANLTNFNPVTDQEKMLRSGFVGKSDSFDWYSSMSVYTHTTGIIATQASVTVNGANQSGSTLNVNCTTGDTFVKGDKISIANVNQVNLMTRNPTTTSTAGSMTFTITANVTGAASTAALPIYPAIYGPGSHYQNVDALPANTAAITFWPGTTITNGAAKTGKIGLALAPGAFLLAAPKLAKPQGSVEWCEQQTDPKTGITFQITRQYENRTLSFTTRLDVIWGRGVGQADQCSVVLAMA